MREGLIAVINTVNSIIAQLVSPETVTTRWFGAGYITSNQSQLRFTIPLNTPMKTGADILTVDYFTIYVRPPTGTTYITLRLNDDFTLTEFRVATTGIRCIAVLNTPITTIPNNSVVGIDADFGAHWTLPV